MAGVIEIYHSTPKLSKDRDISISLFVLTGEVGSSADWGGSRDCLLRHKSSASVTSTEPTASWKTQDRATLALCWITHVIVTMPAVPSLHRAAQRRVGFLTGHRRLRRGRCCLTAATRRGRRGASHADARRRHRDIAERPARPHRDATRRGRSGRCGQRLSALCPRLADCE